MMKKKIKDLTVEEVEKICDKQTDCDNCPLDIPSCRICMKDITIYNIGFLEKEIEVEEK